MPQSCRLEQRLLAFWFVFNDGVTLWIQGDDAERRPVAGVPRPPRGMPQPSPLLELRLSAVGELLASQVPTAYDSSWRNVLACVVN